MCIFSKKKLKTKHSETDNLYTLTRRKSAISYRKNLKFCTSAGYNLELLINDHFFTKRLSIIFF